MAAQKKPSGLGRGLDELLDDNTPTTRSNAGKPLVVSKGEVKASNNQNLTALYGNQTKSLYDERPRTRSVKSNFKK